MMKFEAVSRSKFREKCCLTFITHFLRNIRFRLLQQTTHVREPRPAIPEIILTEPAVLENIPDMEPSKNPSADQPTAPLSIEEEEAVLPPEETVSVFITDS